MADLSLSVLFSAIDRLSQPIRNISQGFAKLGDRIIESGERLAAMGLLGREGIENIARFSESMEEPAIGMDKALARLHAISGLTGKDLADIRDKAIEFSNINPGTTADEWVNGFTRMKGIFQDTGRAVEAENVAGQMRQIGIEGDTAAKLMQVSWSSLGAEPRKVGDEIARVTRVFGLSAEQVNMLAMSTGRLAPIAKLTGGTLSEVLTMGAEAQRELGGGRGAMVFTQITKGIESAVAARKLVVDMRHGILGMYEDLRRQITGPLTLPPNFQTLGKKAKEKFLAAARAGETERIKALGIGDPAQVIAILNHLDEIKKKNDEVANSTMTLNKAGKEATDDYKDATDRLKQSWQNFGDALEHTAVKEEKGKVNELSDAINWLTKQTDDYPRAATAVAIGLKVVGVGGEVTIQALQTLSGIMILSGAIMKAFRGTAEATAAAETLAGVAATGEATGIGAAGAAAGVATPLFEGLWDAILGPVGLVILAVTAFIALAELTYKYWNPIKAFFKKLWDDIKKIFFDVVDWMKDAGSKMMLRLEEGISFAAHHPIEAAEKVAHGIGRLFRFHSPPEVGPLREAVLNFRLGEELARRLNARPAFMGATALAGSFAGAMSPSFYSDQPRHLAEGGRGNVNQTFNITLNIDGNAPDGFSPQAHADAFYRAIKDKMYREERLRFDSGL